MHRLYSYIVLFILFVYAKIVKFALFQSGRCAIPKPIVADRYRCCIHFPNIVMYMFSVRLNMHRCSGECGYTLYRQHQYSIFSRQLCMTIHYNIHMLFCCRCALAWAHITLFVIWERFQRASYKLRNISALYGKRLSYINGNFFHRVACTRANMPHALRL